jgi:DNA-binding Lrp family transcriptional regulator
MDQTDIAISNMLLANSRLSFREMADKLGISANAVHKRIQSLEAQGIIRRYTTKLSLFGLRAFLIHIYGRSEAVHMDVLREAVSRDDRTFWFCVASGNFVYIGAYLQSLTELASYSEKIKKECMISSPIIGIVASPEPDSSVDLTMLQMDYRIAQELSDNSRKDISQISERLGISAKTARRRLQRLTDLRLVEQSIEWYPDSSNDVIAIFHMKVKDSYGLMDAFRAVNCYRPNLLFQMVYTNLPGTMLCYMWTNNFRDLKAIYDHMEKEPFCEYIIPNILLTGYIFKTWREKLLEQKALTKPE